MELNYQHLVEQLEPIIKQAGDLTLRYFRNNPIVRKKDDKSLVTQADIESEQYLLGAIAQMVPQATCIAEESGSSGESDYQWVIDPLDGTTNFAHGLDYFSISVALTYRGISVVGMIYNPPSGELFYAYKDGGAFLNGAPMYVSTPHLFEQSSVVLGLPFATNPRYELIFNTIKNEHTSLPFTIRHFGSAALDMAYVACGRMDGVFFADLSWWDVAAGSLIIQEAGGIVTDFIGNPITQANYLSCVAASRAIHNKIMKFLI